MCDAKLAFHDLNLSQVSPSTMLGLLVQTKTPYASIPPQTPVNRTALTNAPRPERGTKENPPSRTPPSQASPPTTLRSHQSVLPKHPPRPTLASEGSAVVPTIQVPTPGQAFEFLVRFGLDGLAQLDPNGPVARQTHGVGPRDVAATGIAVAGVADEEGVGHFVQQGAEGPQGRLARERLRRVGFWDLDQGTGVFVGRRRDYCCLAV